MFATYEGQVMDATDADGNLTKILVQQLMDDHSTSLYEMRRDGYTGTDCDADALLDWLGY